ncbi:MAG: DUF1816 domain-containing protein [Xenococcaceae cyanobacterium MO_188.B32]|nr:DUF1816 domain-containing protein [Xenococcaceae cyanobacterium MO_188.B32]
MPTRQMPWWIKITTEVPKCIYFFGPFDSSSEAQLLQYGYIEDLKGEKARVISVDIQQCEPKELTIIEEEDF